MKYFFSFCYYLVALRNEATEIVVNVAAPADGAHQVVLPPSVQQQAFLSRK